MKTQNRLFGLIMLLIPAIILLSTAECHAQVKNMTAQELTVESTSVLYGKCTKVESAWTESKEMIFTTVTIVPEYYVKGSQGTEVTITVPGGQVGDIIYEVSEMPAFAKGEEVFAFIWEHPSGVNLVTGGYQGKLKIGKDAKTGIRTVSGKKTGKVMPIQANKEATLSKSEEKRVLLEDFTREVEGYLIKQ